MFDGTADFDPGPGTVQRTSTGGNSFVLKLNTGGNFQWIKQVEGSMFGQRTISVDDAGNVYLAGNFDLRNGTATFPTGEVLTSVGISDIFVLKLDKLGLDNSTTTYNSTDINKALKDRKGKNPGKTNSMLTIPDSYDILDLNVQLDISHTRDEDLDVYLLAPDGTTRVELFTDEGNGGGNFFDGIILDSEAFTPITSGIVGTRRYQPEGDLSVFNTKNTAGTWTLQIEDDEKFQVGTLYSWSITVTHPTPGPNDPPTANNDSATTDEDAAVVIDVLANDTDPNIGDTLTVTSFDATSDNGASISINPDGSVTYDPTSSTTIQDLTDGQILIDTFSYTIGDGKGGSSSATVTVTVNGLEESDGPTITGVSSNFANPNEQKTVTVTGTGFADGATADFGNKVNVQSVTFISDTELAVQIKVHRRASLGLRDVTITNPDNSTVTCSGCFNVGSSPASPSSTQTIAPAQSFNLSGSDETSTDTTDVQPTDPTLLIVDPVLIEEEPDDESATDDDPVIIPEDQADLDSLFGDLEGSLQEELLAV